MARATIPIFSLAAVGALALALPWSSKTPTEPSSIASAAPKAPSGKYPRVAVLGIDGLDPELLLETIDRYPDRTRNFQKLIAQGGIHDLGTSCPPQSPVAWSNFITGRNPGGHGVFDFIHRDPTTRSPMPGSVKVEAASSVDLWGEWKFPIGGESVSNRSGESFWVTLAKHGVPADIWRMPANFPVEPAEGVSFCGMMTPALDSAYGTYTIFSSDPPGEKERSGGKYVTVREYEKGYIRTEIEGPPNSFKKKDPQEKAKLEFHIDRESQSVAVDTGMDVVIMEPGDWSDFVTVEFELLPMGMMNMTGICRFYLRSIDPVFELYASPVNIDPVNPVMPVSEPISASAELVDAIGYYYTQGMAEEVNALKDEAIDDLEFVTQTKLIYEQRVRMMDVALDQYLEKDEGFFFFYYSTIDLNCHMLWRYYDEDHPQHPMVAERAGQDSSFWSGREGSIWKEVIYDFYLMMDPVVGTLMDRVPDDTLVVVMSDHGFASYRRTFSLNRWLVEHGYMVLKEGRSYELPQDDENWEEVLIYDYIQPGAVDWTKTRAYGMGFNGLYLNLEGREKDIEGTDAIESGIVRRGTEAESLLREIKAKLEAERDQGNRPIVVADITADVYSGERLADAPDMQIGFNAGYGNSDAASTGRIPRDIYADNLKGGFNGNHLMAPEVVAGILLTNGVVRPGEHALEDLTVDILEKYGIEPGEGQDGHPVIE